MHILGEFQLQQPQVCGLRMPPLCCRGPGSLVYAQSSSGHQLDSLYVEAKLPSLHVFCARNYEPTVPSILLIMAIIPIVATC